MIGAASQNFVTSVVLDAEATRKNRSFGDHSPFQQIVNVIVLNACDVLF